MRQQFSVDRPLLNAEETFWLRTVDCNTVDILSLFLPRMFSVFSDYLRKRIPISDQQLKEVEPLFKTKKVDKGKIILQLGEVCQFTYFITNGCLRSYVIDDKGKEHILQFAIENWWISEQISFINHEPSMYFIDAVEETEFVQTDEQGWNEFHKIVPAALDMNRKLQLNSLRSFQKRLVSHLSASGEQRYLSFIKTYPPLALRLPQKMIASYLGVTPESLSRIRKELAMQ
jgi:CRP-like cAMP-binding protein